MTEPIRTSREELKERIALLDLQPIKVKLMEPEEGEGWTREKVEQVDELYRRFLFLSVTRDEPIVPTRDIDKFWHAHILDTRKYADDCERTFGFFLHHFPYFGMRGAADASALQEAFERTKQIYRDEFAAPSSILAGKEIEQGFSGTCNACGSQSRCRNGAVGTMHTELRPTLD